MGVPGLWPFIRSHFGRCAVRHFQRGTKRYQFNYVYLDANGLLHGAAQKVYNYGDGKRKLNPYSKLNEEEKLLKVFELFFDDILDVTSMAVPTQVLYIAIDGPAPRAKQNQQRERRFIAAQARLAEEKITGESRFDSNQISPGTEFMQRLSQFMYWKIRHYMQTRGPWHNVQVIYSPPTIPGEGEHKIMDYIRQLSKSERSSASHCMFGPDGDLLMLTLAVHVKKMSLFRADQYDPGNYDLVDMSKIRRELAKSLGQWTAVKQGQRTEDDVSNDFVFIGFFVGNDFLPKVKMFYKLDEGLQKMFDTYIETSERGFQHHLTEDTQILVQGFRRFAYRLSEFETEYLAAQTTVTAIDPRFVDHTLLKYATITTPHAGAPTVASIDMQSYREGYYNKAGIAGKNSEFKFEEGVEKMCREYFRNLVWVYLYYVAGLPSWEQAYTYHYAPLLADLVKYLETIQQCDLEKELKFDPSHAARPFEQLLSILPSTSKELLPEEFRDIMTSSESSLVEAGYYPETFDIDYEGKRKEHEGIALLPFVDYMVVSKAYNQRAEKIGKKWHRNQRGTVYGFNWIGTGFLTNYTSHYGNISNCRVKVTPL